MIVPLFDDPREGSFATSKFMLLGRLNFSNLLKACFLSYFEFGLLPPPQRQLLMGFPW